MGVTEIIIIAAIIAGFAFFIVWQKGVFRKKTDAPVNTGVHPIILAKLKDIGRLEDYQTTPAGSKISSVVKIPEIAKTVLDDAEKVLLYHFRHHFPHWTNKMTAGNMDVLFIKPDGVLETIPDYPRPFLNVGVNTAGTVVFGTRTFLLLPHHESINWSNIHYLLFTYIAEGEHAKEYENDRAEWARYTSFEDSHPHRPYHAGTPFPPYADQTIHARAFASKSNNSCNIKVVEATPEIERELKRLMK